MDPTANEGVSAFSGLKYFRALMEGSIARSAMLELFDINIEAAEPGLVVLTAIPTAEHYNPLDSSMVVTRPSCSIPAWQRPS